MLVFDNPRLQRGRGLGGLFKNFAKLASPFFATAAKSAKQVVKSDAGKRMLKSIKQQAIESGSNVLQDVIEGKDLGESVTSEFDDVRGKVRKAATRALSNLGNRKRKAKTVKQQTPSKKRRKVRKKGAKIAIF